MYLKRLLGVRLLAEQDTDKLIVGSRHSKIKSAIYKLGSQCLIDRRFPLHIYLESSSACNYKCPMCPRDSDDAVSINKGHFPLDLAQKIISEAAKKGPTSYSLHMLGEPLVNPKWYKIVEMIRSSHRCNAVLLTTNAFLMHEANIKKLIELRVSRIFASIHSMVPDVYKKNTGGGNLGVVMKNIHSFARIAGRSCKTKLFVRLFLGPGDPEPITDQETTELKRMGVFLEVRGYHNFAGSKEEWTTYKKTAERYPCFHPWFTVGVAVDGKTTLCCADYRMDLVLGNAYDKSIEEMWQSERVRSIRDNHLSNTFQNSKICESCDTWQFHPDIFFDRQKKLELNDKFANQKILKPISK